jgi:hypothetical protein
MVKRDRAACTSKWYECAPLSAERQYYHSICRYASMDVGVLLQQLENTPGVVVLITNKVCISFSPKARYQRSCRTAGACHSQQVSALKFLHLVTCSRAAWTQPSSGASASNCSLPCRRPACVPSFGASCCLSRCGYTRRICDALADRLAGRRHMRSP